MPLLQALLLLMSYLLLLPLLHVEAATTVAHALDSSFANGNSLKIDAGFVRLVYPVVSFARGFLSFLRQSIPPWLFLLTFAAAVSPHICQALAIILTAVVAVPGKALDHWLAHQRNATIADLRQQLSTRYDPDEVIHQFEAYDNEILQLKQELEASRSESLRSNGELRTSQDAAAAKQHLVDDLNYQIEIVEELYNTRAVRAKNKQADRELRQAQNEIIDLKQQVAELEGKYVRAQRRISEDQWVYEDQSKFKRVYEAKISEKQDTIDQQMAEIAQLKHNPAVHQLQHQVAILAAVKAVTFQMVESNNKSCQVIATLFVTALRESGIDLTQLGIDPQQHQSYLTWATDMLETGSSCLDPSTGFGLPDSRRGALSGIYVLGNKIFEATAPFSHNNSFGSPTWASPQANGMVQSHPAPSFDNTPNFDHTSNFPGNILLQGSDTFSASAPASNSGLGQSSTPATGSGSAAVAASVFSGSCSFGSTAAFCGTPESYTSSMAAISSPPAPTGAPTTAGSPSSHAAPAFGAPTSSSPAPQGISTWLGAGSAPASMTNAGGAPGSCSALRSSPAGASALTEPIAAPATTIQTHHYSTPGYGGNTSFSGQGHDSVSRGGLAAGLKRATFARATAGRAPMSAFCSSVADSTEGAEPNRLSQMSKKLPPLFGENGLPFVQYGPFDTATWQYQPGTLSHPCPDWDDVLELPYFTGDLPWLNDLSMKPTDCIDDDWINKRIDNVFEMHEKTDAENFFRKLYMQHCNYRRRSDAVRHIRSVYRSTGWAAKSRGPDLLRRVPTRVAACRSSLRGRGGISKRFF